MATASDVSLRPGAEPRAGAAGRSGGPVRPSFDRIAGLRRVLQLLALLRWPTLAIAAIFAPLLVEEAAFVAPVYGLLAGAAVYNLAITIALRFASGPAMVTALGYAAIVLDIVTLSGAIAVTGGLASDFHVAFYPIVIYLSIYYRSWEAALGTLLALIGYAAAITVGSGFDVWITGADLYGLRVSFLVLAGLFVGWLARERFLLSDLAERLHAEVERRARGEQLVQAMSSAMAVVQELDTRQGDTQAAVLEQLSVNLSAIGLDLMLATDTGDEDRFAVSFTSITGPRRAALEGILGVPHNQWRINWRGSPGVRDVVRTATARYFPSAAPYVQAFEPRLSAAVETRVLRALGDPQTVVAPLIEGRRVNGLVTVLGSPLYPEDAPVVMAFARQVSIGLRTLARIGELARLERSKSEFLAMVSHELKTPLTAIKTATELLDELEQRAGDSPRARLVRSIRKGVGSLERMTVELLDLARMQDAELQLERRPTNVGEVIDGVITELQPLLREKNQRLITHISPLVGPANVDPNRFAQIVANLLGNANKYTPPGGTISVSADEEGPNLVVRVRDTGPGIPPEEQRWIFEPFYRGSSAERLAQAGSGLGLAIARSLVELHGGRIWVESAPGQGATFAFSIAQES